MSDALLYAATLLGLMGIVVSRVGPERLSKIVPGVGWLGLVAGFGLLAAGQVTDLRAAVGTALFAGLAVISGGLTSARRDALAGASAVVFVAGAVGVIAAPAESVATPGHLILITGVFAGLAAAVAGLVGSAASRGGLGASGLALAAAGAVGAGSIVGFLRSSLTQSTYSVPLRTAQGDPIFWELPGVEGLPEGLRLTATLDIPQMPWIVGATIAVAVVAAILELTKKSLPALVAWVLVVAGCAGALGLMHVASTEARLPVAQGYEDATRQVLADARAQEALVSRASFTGEGEVVLARADVAPEFFGFGLGLLLALFALSRRIGPFATEEDEERELADELASRDLALRAVLFGWLAILAAGLVHLGYFGVAAMASGSEWASIGALLMATGLIVAMFERRQAPGVAAFRALAPGLAAAAILLIVGLGFAFGTPFGLSINAF